ncbi:MAG: ATP phosphoribosyltransferase [Chloroflexi bacterium]|nr:MAG: ATP phosphoribosyltransferase [Chloroflexota bacterium]MBL1192901.1 ATP phosphoribosyltransferase [Chloroflexota bacterium]NOH10193.1 ATP phosphoribosyltransferase [Chloroflexota bacterium]
MTSEQKEIRIALPSKGRLAEQSLQFLNDAGLRVYKPNPRQYQATIPAFPELAVIFQRPGDIVVGVRQGSVDFGITGWDMFAERRGTEDKTLALHAGLGFGHCTLNVIVPDKWNEVRQMGDLKKVRQEVGRPLRVASKFPNVTKTYFEEYGLEDSKLITAEGTLEIAPTVGYADMIVDLVSTGTTLRDNRLRTLEDGTILSSQACLIANRASLQENGQAMAQAKRLLEYIVAYLRATDNLSVYANMRGESPEEIAQAMFTKEVIGGLQGPTISPIVTREGNGWYAAHLIIHKNQLSQAIAELREVGGSGVVVTPVTYIFEEEPQEYLDMLAALEN